MIVIAMQCCKNYRQYDESYKQKAVFLVNHLDYSIRQAAIELGVARSTIRRWLMHHSGYRETKKPQAQKQDLWYEIHQLQKKLDSLKRAYQAILAESHL